MQLCIPSIAAILGLSAVWVAAAPTAKRNENYNPFPLPNGFPHPSSEQIKGIEQQALGTLPNSPPPATISQQGITNLQVIAFNEQFEVAFFTDLLYNVTNNVTGYVVDDSHKRALLIEALTAIQAQEQLHALDANNALAHFNSTTILTCNYMFPVSDLQSAIQLASTFTSVVLGTLQDIIQIFGETGNGGLARLIAAVVGNEGEQQGFFRVSLDKVPSELPFLTTATRDFAFNAVNQSFIVPGSCPNTNIIDVNNFEPLTLLTPVKEAKTQYLEFSFQSTAEDVSQLKLVYINQLNVPIVVEFEVVGIQGSTVAIRALFPYEQNLMNGLTIAALARGDASSFTNADQVSRVTEFGPALIIVN